MGLVRFQYWLSADYLSQCIDRSARWSQERRFSSGVSKRQWPDIRYGEKRAIRFDENFAIVDRRNAAHGRKPPATLTSRAVAPALAGDAYLVSKFERGGTMLWHGRMQRLSSTACED